MKPKRIIQFDAMIGMNMRLSNKISNINNYLKNQIEKTEQDLSVLTIQVKDLDGKKHLHEKLKFAYEDKCVAKRVAKAKLAAYKEMLNIVSDESIEDRKPLECKQNITVSLDKDETVKNYKYQVIFIDEYNNMYLIGFFNNLRDSEPELNNYLKGYVATDDDTEEEFEPQFGDNTKLEHLTEYVSTYGKCFDKEICVEEGCVQIRGFVF